MHTLQLHINGKKVGPLQISEEIMMIEFLHEYLNLTGTKFGCGQGQCNACVIIVDHADGHSETMKTCINSALMFNNKHVRTIEGHAEKNAQGYAVKLNPVQEAFIKQFSFQCGWCTSGFVNEATVLVETLQKQPVQLHDVESLIEDTLNKHICRCTGYVKYYKSMKALILAQQGVKKS